MDPAHFIVFFPGKGSVSSIILKGYYTMYLKISTLCLKNTVLPQVAHLDARFVSQFLWKENLGNDLSAAKKLANEASGPPFQGPSNNAVVLWSSRALDGEKFAKSLTLCNSNRFAKIATLQIFWQSNIFYCIMNTL